jgi:crotonobetainyl-CoA:carnitine CoA-transferase CaiB-like acyl-CoA transferase
LQIHGIAKVPARRAPEIGEHNDQVLKQLGFSAQDIDDLRASGAIPLNGHFEKSAAGARA